MWKQNSIALAIAVVIASNASFPTASAGRSIGRPNDMLSLTHREKRLAWRDLHRHARYYYRVPGFEPIDHGVLHQLLLLSQLPAVRRAMYRRLWGMTS